MRNELIAKIWTILWVVWRDIVVLWSCNLWWNFIFGWLDGWTITLVQGFLIPSKDIVKHCIPCFIWVAMLFYRFNEIKHVASNQKFLILANTQCLQTMHYWKSLQADFFSLSGNMLNWDISDILTWLPSKYEIWAYNVVMTGWQLKNIKWQDRRDI